MKLNFTVSLGDIEVETDSETGRVESAYVVFENVADQAFGDVLPLIVGQKKWSELIAKAVYEFNPNPGPDCLEDDEYGVPV
jgi:hypothetical protein